MTAPPSPPSVPQTMQTNSARFTEIVMRQFGGTVGAPQVTDFQKRLIQGYFIAIDRALKMAEDERIRKNKENADHKWDNNLPVCWENVNSLDLALDVVHYARMGLDMMQDNHLFPIPYKNNKTNKYDVNLMPGYNGIRYIATKYAVEPPVAVTVELVYSTDTFIPIKKSNENRVESYQFVINQPFDRGEIKGGFGYIEYPDPARNELIIMTMKDIQKRKPQYASANFWGGTKKEWQTVEGRRQKVDVPVDGWLDEMCRKTLIREVFSSKHIPRDPQKIDDSYQYMKLREAQMAEIQAQENIDAYANGDVIDTTPELPRAAPPELPPPPQEITSVPQTGYQVNQDTGEIMDAPAPAPAPYAPPAMQDGPGGQQTMIGGPEF